VPSHVIRVLAGYAQRSTLDPPLTRPDRSTLRINQHCSLGGIISPLLANIALSVLDEHFCAKWDAHPTPYRREVHRKRGGATYRIVRYADDFVIMVAGTRAHAEALWAETAEVIAPLGLRLSVEKTGVCHLDEGFDFLGFAASNGTGRRAATSSPSTPTRRRRRCFPSRRRCGR